MPGSWLSRYSPVARALGRALLRHAILLGREACNGFGSLAVGGHGVSGSSDAVARTRRKAYAGRRLLRCCRWIAMPLPFGSSLARLIEAPVRPGIVEWIGVRPARRRRWRSSTAVDLVAGDGLAGDRYGECRRRSPGLVRSPPKAWPRSRATSAATPSLRDDLRRNIVVRGINLVALKGRRFRVGRAVLEASGECHPCSRIEESARHRRLQRRARPRRHHGAGDRKRHVRVGDRVEPIGEQLTRATAPRATALSSSASSIRCGRRSRASRRGRARGCRG